MTTELAQGRARRATLIGAIAAALVVVAAATVAIGMRSRDANQVAGPVLPGFAEKAAAAERIVVLSKDARYEIQRTEKAWVLKDRGNYPVRREVLAQFTDGLKSLAYVRPMTTDPARHERLGLGDPAEGGSGVAVQVEDARGARLADLIIGEQPGGAIFLRKPGEDRTWQVRGRMPPLRDPARWLDLAPLEMDVARITSADVQPAAGPAYTVRRDDGQGAFTLAPPNDATPVISPGGVADAAMKLARLQPVDVRTAATVTSAPRARVRTRTFDGLALESELFEESDGRRWLKLIARAENAEKEDEARGINARVGPWAYALSEADFAALAPPLSALARAPEPPPEEPKAKAKKKR
jgi:hypothetical protein